MRVTHGMRHTPEYDAWHAMRQRCGNPRHAGFANYGGRGIVICERWDTFENFLADMGRRPSAQHSLDRRDNDGNYEPDNCRWATPLEQQRNTRRTKLIEFRGETKSLRQWALSVGLVPQTLGRRLLYGWPLAKAMTTPGRPHA